MLRDCLLEVLDQFPNAVSEPFGSHPAGDLLRSKAADEVRASLGATAGLLKVKGSPGSGRWADVPWVTLMDPRVTTTPTRGYYLVYLFNWRKKKVYLSLNQGSTQVTAEHGPQRDKVLRQRAALLRSRLPAIPFPFDAQPIDLNGETDLARSYEPGHVIGVSYAAAEMPEESILHQHLSTATQLYLSLVSLGGLDSLVDESDEDRMALERPQATSVLEKRLYRTHKAIERRAENSKKAKAFHGHTCQACGFNFEKWYGTTGQGYIEAHHRVPLASLQHGLPVAIDIGTGFCVLCANCHRMIHRMPDPSDLDALKALIQLSRLTESPSL